MLSLPTRTPARRRPLSSVDRASSFRNRLFRLILALLGLAACETVPDFPNKPLATGAANVPHASILGANPDDPLILIGFSGGGARAAAVGLGVLDELAATQFVSGGRTIRLVDQIKVVSSVSGGSVVGAWFVLAGPDQMDALKTNFLMRDNMGALLRQAADPLTWDRLAFSKFTRSDAMRDLLDRELFQKKRFSDLPPGAPYLLMNATDMESEEIFAFSPNRFDDICSDLGELPISVGVTASAAFPVALSPVSLKNYSYEGCKPPPTEWIGDELHKTGPRYIALETYKRARYANALRRGSDPYRNEHYIHLLDGGLADNQGVHSLSEALVSPTGGTDLLYGLNTGKARRVVVIAVNARSDAEAGVGDNPSVPGMWKVLNTVIGAPIDSTTALANATLQDLIASLQNAGDARLRVYGIPIDFDQFPDSEAALRTSVKNIGTSWNISPAALADSLKAGRMLLRQHPCYLHLLIDLGVPVDGDERRFATTYCRYSGDPPT